MKYRPLATILLLLVSSCSYEDKPRVSICTETELSIVATPQNTSGCGSSDGMITAIVTGGSGTYKFSIDGGKTKQTTNTFEQLTGGAYLVTVYDGSACSASTEVTVGTNGSTFAAGIIPNTIFADTECLSNNGSVELQATGGTGPYSFTLGGITNSTGVFSLLASGSFSAIVSDNAGCSVNIAITIPSDISTSYVNEIKPILDAKCNFSDCHKNNPPRVSLTIYDDPNSTKDVKGYASQIKSMTGSNPPSMPKNPNTHGGPLTSDEIKKIACWVDAGAKDN